MKNIDIIYVHPYFYEHKRKERYGYAHKMIRDLFFKAHISDGLEDPWITNDYHANIPAGFFANKFNYVATLKRQKVKRYSPGQKRRIHKKKYNLILKINEHGKDYTISKVNLVSVPEASLIIYRHIIKFEKSNLFKKIIWDDVTHPDNRRHVFMNTIAGYQWICSSFSDAFIRQVCLKNDGDYIIVRSDYSIDWNAAQQIHDRFISEHPDPLLTSKSYRLNDDTAHNLIFKTRNFNNHKKYLELNYTTFFSNNASRFFFNKEVDISPEIKEEIQMLLQVDNLVVRYISMRKFHRVKLWN